MRIQELFEDVGDYSLYHLLSFDKAEAVVTSNTMEARWMHEIDGREVYGNSMTRNSLFNFGGNYPFRFIFDSRLLRTRHRIIPLDAEIVHRNTYRKGRYARPDRHNDDPKGQYREEFVIGTIRNLNRFITRVEIRAENQIGQVYNPVAAVLEWCKRNSIPYTVSPKTIERIRALEADWSEDEIDFEPLFPQLGKSNYWSGG